MWMEPVFIVGTNTFGVIVCGYTLGLVCGLSIGVGAAGGVTVTDPAPGLSAGVMEDEESGIIRPSMRDSLDTGISSTALYGSCRQGPDGGVKEIVEEVACGRRDGDGRTTREGIHTAGASYSTQATRVSLLLLFMWGENIVAIKPIRNREHVREQERERLYAYVRDNSPPDLQID